jgi:hypothetical protein
MKKLAILAVIGMGFAGFLGQAQQTLQTPFRFVALGDMPYATPADYPKFEKLITKINANNPAFRSCLNASRTRV